MRLTCFSVLASLLLIHTSLQAQQFGVRFGANFSTARVYDSSVKVPTSYNPGITLGAMGDIEFDGKLHFTPSVMYSLKGYTFKPVNSTIEKVSTIIQYIELGAMLSYNIPSLIKGFAISAGPTAAVAVSGKEKITESGVTTSSKMKFSLEKDYGWFDMGMFFGASYAFKKYIIQAGYQANFININNNAESDKRNIRNRTISLTFGYFLR